MKTKLLVIAVLLFGVSPLLGQQLVKQAYLDDEGKVNVKEIILEDESLFKSDYSREQTGPWPIRVAANPTFKNFRGVTLADINGDGAEEILVASHNKLYAYKGNGELLWSLQLTGTATYPPSVADVNGNGLLDVVQLTGGIPNNGRVYLINAADGEVHDGWPLSFNNQWILSAPALADLNDDGQMEIIFGVRTVNELHIVKADGTTFNENWPQVLASVPAFTPSVGDINNDGEPNIIASASNGTLYAFDLEGNLLPGFPVQATGTGFSYQSPLLVDFDNNGYLSIVGANHGDDPQFYIREHDGSYREGWPQPINSWTYNPPTVVDIDGMGDFEVFMSVPIGEDPMPMLFGYNPAGELLDNFPITKPGGLEGFISVADIDNDANHELIFGSNLMVEGKGFIHAYKTDGTGELDGFPLRPDGFTFMNGANLGDVTGDGMLNLVALSYEQTFSVTDSTVINVWDLGISVEDADVLFGTYKGSNTRTGLVGEIVEPGPVWVMFRLVNASHDLGEVNVFINDELRKENFVTGMSSDTIRVHAYQPFNLEIQDAQTQEILLSEFFEIGLDTDGWLIVMAGNDQDESYPLDYYVYESMRTGHTSNGMIDLLIFNAFAAPSGNIHYEFENLPDAATEFTFGEFAGYYSTPFEETQMSVTMYHADTDEFIHTNMFQLTPHFELGSAAHMVLLDFFPAQPQQDYDFPFLLLIPPAEGMFIAPVVSSVSVADITEKIQLSIYPNPASASFTLKLNASGAADLTVEVFDLTGRKLLTHQDIVTKAGPFHTTIPVNNLKAGYYLLRCKLGSHNVSIPLMINN